MRKAFTLIELLVVIAIIAILAAILFPVFAQAKAAAKKTQGLAQSKQIGTALQMYLNDNDDILPPYRFTANTPINPYYLKLKAANDPKAARYDTDGASTKNAYFINQMLDPYVKNDQIWISPGNSKGWVNFQDKGTWDAGFFSYGGQNSYGVNNYLLTAISPTSTTAPMSASSVAEVSNTLLMVDATYYNTLPAQRKGMAFCKINGYAPTGASYPHYWKHLGNNELNFNSLGNADPDDASNVSVFKNIESRFSGVLNVVKVDSSAKALQARKLVYDLRNDPVTSIWNPLKTACE
ncbi:MAG: prepilin-type N-terminal cleavage/methylation domain-containing protein [Armatimonadetes bacterium]|nr:prepilin-type N-terminal cleavage/methylation domain-containing protein [Armatimonadota bacterium]